MHLNDLITLTRKYIDVPSADATSEGTDDTELLLYINAEQRHLFSIARNAEEDWLGQEFVFLPSNGTYNYYLPMNSVALRRVEMISGASVSGSSPFFSVDESTADPIEVEFGTLNNSPGSYVHRRGDRLVSLEGYFLYGDQIRFNQGMTLGSDGRYCRIFFTPTTPDLHRATAAAGTSSTITLGTTGTASTVGTIKTVDNYYKDMRVEIISGTGSGQVRRVSQYVGSTKVATMDANWSTTPDSTSVYSINCPIVDDYHELLALGAAIRRQGLKVEDDISSLTQVYSGLMEEFKNSIETRNKSRSRRVVSKRGY